MSRYFDDSANVFPENPDGEPFFERDGVDYIRIHGFDDYYVGSNGEVVSYVKGSPRAMSTWPNQHGHRYTRLWNSGRTKTASVHRLVAEHHLPNPNGYSVVRHLDDDPENNEVRNLAWGTQCDNVHDMLEHGHGSMKKVVCNETGEVFMSCAEVADRLGVSRSSVTLCCQKKIKRLHGKTYSYI